MPNSTDQKFDAFHDFALAEFEKKSLKFSPNSFILQNSAEKDEDLPGLLDLLFHFL